MLQALFSLAWKSSEKENDPDQSLNDDYDVNKKTSLHQIK